MAKTKGRRIEWWRNSGGDINYRLIAANGEILYATNQGFENTAGMYKNIRSVVEALKHGIEHITFEKVVRKK